MILLDSASHDQALLLLGEVDAQISAEIILGISRERTLLDCDCSLLLTRCTPGCAAKIDGFYHLQPESQYKVHLRTQLPRSTYPRAAIV
jgi:hypothetical protein